MKAFHGDLQIKQKYVNRVTAHFEADEIIKGQYWQKGKGCAVGCTVHSDDHLAYETELGIPQWLARVEDQIFEGLPFERAKHWPSEFLNVINVGADLNKIKAPFLIFILESTLDKFDHIKHPKVKSVVDKVIALYKDENSTPEDFKKARSAAYAASAAAAADAAAAAASASAAADAAAAAAASADAAADAASADAASASASADAASASADAASASAAADAASAAAASASAAAAYAASAAAYAAAAAAYAADAAAAAYAADAADAAAASAAAYAASASASASASAAAASAAADAASADAASADARQNLYVKFADKLLELLRDCK